MTFWPTFAFVAVSLWAAHTTYQAWWWKRMAHDWRDLCRKLDDERKQLETGR